MDSGNWRIKRDPSDAPPTTPNKSSFGSRTQPGSNDRGSSYTSRSREGGVNQTQSRDGWKPRSDPKAEQAIEEGRRLYVGNMAYEATVKDVEGLLIDLAQGIEAINMAIDPMTGRNPSYCFVDFTSKELAEQVIEEYNGREFMRRPLKVKPGIRSKGSSNVRHDVRESFSSENTRSPAASPLSTPTNDRWRRPDDAQVRNTATEEGRRLFVGNLPRFSGKAETDEKMYELLKDFKVEVVSKLVSPHEGSADSSHFCFIDLASAKEVDEAIDKLNGTEKWGVILRVNRAKGTAKKIAESRRLFIGGLPEMPETEVETIIKAIFSGYDVSTVSKLFQPKESAVEREGNHCFCFVELADEVQTDKAMAELDWTEAWGGKIRVKPSLSGNNRTEQRPERSSPRGWGPRRP